METVFDHNITDEEMMTMFGMVVDRSVFEKADQRRNYEFIYRLYHECRGDDIQAMKYADRIPNDQRKMFSLLWCDRP